MFLAKIKKVTLYYTSAKTYISLFGYSFYFLKKILQHCKNIASGKVVESLSLIYMEKLLSDPDASPVPYVSIRSSE